MIDMTDETRMPCGCFRVGADRRAAHSESSRAPQMYRDAGCDALTDALKAEYDKCLVKWNGNSEPAALETLERLFGGYIVVPPLLR